MTAKQWRIFWWTAWGLMLALVIFFAYYEPAKPDPLRRIEGFQDLQLGGKLSQQQRDNWEQQAVSGTDFEMAYTVERMWKLGQTPYPVLVELCYDSRQRLAQITLTLRDNDIPPGELELASERARSYFSSHYAAGSIDYHQDPAQHREVIKITGDNGNGITITFSDDLLDTVVFAPLAED